MKGEGDNRGDLDSVMRKRRGKKKGGARKR